MSLEVLFLVLCLVALWCVAFDLLWSTVLKLRAAAGTWEKEKDEFKTDAIAMRDRLSKEAQALGDGEHAEPYKPLYDRGRMLVAGRMGDIANAMTAAGDSRADEIPKTLLKPSVLLLPLFDEMRARRDWHSRSQQLSRRATDARTALGEIGRIRQDIAGLGKKYKNRAQQERDRAQKLSDEIHATELPALADMLDRSKKIVNLFDQANSLLAADDPAEPQVCSAYPDILEGGKQIDRLDSEFKEYCKEHEQAKAMLAGIAKRADSVDKEITKEKEAGFPVEWLVSERAEWAKEIEEIKDALSHGKVDLDRRVERLSQRIAASNESLNERRAWREKVTAQHVDMTKRLSSAKQWTQTKDPRFEFDLTQSSIDKAEETLRQMQYITHREDRQQEDVTSLTQIVNEQIKTIGTNRQNHENRLEEERNLRGQLGTPLPKTIEKAAALAGRLEACHSRYRAVQPANLKQAGRKLQDAWTRWETHGSLIKESQFEQAVADLRSIQVEHGYLQKLCAQAQENLDARDRDKTEAESVLSQVRAPDRTLTALKDWKDAQSLQESAESSARRLERAMQEPAMQPPADYFEILGQAKELLQQVNGQRSELKRRLEASRKKLTETWDKLTAMQKELDKFQEGSPLSWDDSVTSLERDMNYWQSGFPHVQEQSIERMDQHQKDGENLLTRLNEFYERIKQENSEFAQALSSAEAAVSAAEQSRGNLQLVSRRGLKYGSTGWRSIARDEAESHIAGSRKRLVELQKARSKFAARDAGEKAREIRGNAQSAMRTIEGVQRDLDRAIEGLDFQSKNLQELVQACKRIADSTQDGDVRERWRTIERDIDQWKEVCLTADSPVDAEHILEKARQSARNFARDNKGK